jgi:hypothetical protein
MEKDVFKDPVDAIAKGQTTPEQKKVISAGNIFRRRLRATFYSARLGRDTLPSDVAAFLKGTPPAESDYLSSFVPALSTDVDANCTPR